MTDDSGRIPGHLSDPFRVAGWEVAVASHRISRGGRTVKLEPRTMAVLVYLAGRAGRVVSREELEREVWAGRVVGYEALSNTIAKLRRAFGDDRRHPGVVETVPKAGYRLVAEVENIADPPDHGQAARDHPEDPDAGREGSGPPGTAEDPQMPGQMSGDQPAGRREGPASRRIPVLAAGLALALLAAVAAVRLLAPVPDDPPVGSSATSGKPSVAVLPFDNLSSDPAQDFFADGLTSDLITDLSGISGLFVIARHSVFAYEDPSRPIPEIAEELGVRFVVEGSVRRAEGRIRVNAQLIDARSGINLWSERYERDEMDVFVLQDAVVDDIVESLSIRLSDAERTRLAQRGTDDLEAYDYYLRAEHRWRSCIEVGCEHEAISLYRKAIALDPGFVDAYAGIAEAAWTTWRWNSSNIMPAAAARRLAYEAASKVLSLEAGDPRAYAILASIQALEGRHEQALDSARSAVRLDPNNADAHEALAWILMITGDHAEARSEMQAALRHNPKPPEWYNVQLGKIAFLSRDYEKALELLSGVREYFEARLWAGMTYARLGRSDDARDEIEPTYESVPFANLAYYRTLFGHFQRDADLEHILSALRKAGVPEWPYGFQPTPANQVEHMTLEEISSGHTWIGRDSQGNRFRQQFTEDGRVVFRGRSSLRTGSFHVRGDLLCVKYPGTLAGREDCGYVYRNPDGTSAEHNDYVRVSLGDIYYFSLAPN